MFFPIPVMKLISTRRLTLTSRPDSLGFQDVVTIDMLREAYPVLDVVDHNRRPKDSVSTADITSKRTCVRSAHNICVYPTGSCH